MLRNKINYHMILLLVDLILMICILILILSGLETPLFVVLALFIFFKVYFFIEFNFKFSALLKKIHKALDVLINKDCSLLNMAISEFSRGNLTVRIPQISSEKIDVMKNKSIMNFVDLYNSLHNRLKEKIVDLNNITATPCKRVYYVGADSYIEGTRCGKIAGEALGGQGEIAVFVYSMTNTGQYLRRKGFINTIISDFPNIKIVEVVEEFRDPEKTYQAAISVIKKFPHLKGIYISEGNTPFSAARAINELGKTDNVKIFTHDITEKTVEYIEKGIIACSLSQNPYAQGYNPIILLYNYIITGEEPVIRRILTHLEEVTKENINDHWNKNEGQKISGATKESLVPPVENVLKKHIKIAIILPGDINFWKLVYQGAIDASDLLKKYNVEVIIKIPDAIRKGDFSAASFINALEPLADERCNAIALPLFDPALVEYLNKLVDSGICIATLNSEQINFRGMLDTVSNHTRQLFSVSENLAASSTETYHATIQISNTMNNISTNSMRQIDKITETNSSMEKLLEIINDIYLKSDENLKSVENARSMALSGSGIVNESNLALNEVRKNADSSNLVIRQLNESARKIGEITTIINELAGKTKLIAINASILAARAGNEGKGFFVLADEIRNLSDRSNTSTRDISILIEEILKSVNSVTQMVDLEMEGIRTITGYAIKSENALNDIKQATDESRQKSEDILHCMKEMEDFSMSVKKSMHELIEMNKSNSDSIQEISYSTNEMNQEVHENSNLALKLSKLAQSQEDIVSLFMISDEKI